jgi:hypothetical protein
MQDALRGASVVAALTQVGEDVQRVAHIHLAIVVYIVREIGRPDVTFDE